MFQNPKVTQGQTFHLGFSFAVKLELSHRFCLSSLAELPSARGQSILERVWIEGAARFFQLFSSFWVFSWFLLPWVGRNSQIVVLGFFYYKESFFFSAFSCPSLFFFFFLLSVSFFSSFPCENLSKRLVPQRIVEGDLQWILSKNSSDLSQLFPENAGTTERGLDISWEKEFHKKDLFRAKTSWRKSRGILWEAFLWFWADWRGFRVWFWPRICFFLPLSWHCGRTGSCGCSSGAARGWNVESFWDLCQLQDCKPAMWDGIIPIPSPPPSSRDPVWLQPGGFFCWRATVDAEGASSKWNKIKLGEKNLDLAPQNSSPWSVLLFLLCFSYFFPLFPFLFWHSQSHLLTALCTLRAQQRVLDHLNRAGNSLLKLKMPLECWEHLIPGFLHVPGAVHTPCCSLFQK